VPDPAAQPTAPTLRSELHAEFAATTWTADSNADSNTNSHHHKYDESGNTSNAYSPQDTTVDCTLHAETAMASTTSDPDATNQIEFADRNTQLTVLFDQIITIASLYLVASIGMLIYTGSVTDHGFLGWVAGLVIVFAAYGSLFALAWVAMQIAQLAA